jgi:hypothetical protein
MTQTMYAHVKKWIITDVKFGSGII